ncbi:MAG: DUF2116 family Zn-ribbon domain-containing protein [Halothiobacillus sp.]
MSDDIDTAQVLTEHYRSVAIANRMSDGPVPCGFCHYCAEPIPTDQRWCDRECRNEWQKERDAIARRGGQ